MNMVPHRRWGNAMKDMEARLEKVRTDAAEWALLSATAPDEVARKLFAQLSAYLTELAGEVERVLGATRHWLTGIETLSLSCNVASAPERRATRPLHRDRSRFCKYARTRRISQPMSVVPAKSCPAPGK